MAAILLSEVVDTHKIYKSFQEFIVGDSVLGTTAGIVVGIGTYTFVRSATFDVVLPLLNVLLLGGVRFIHAPTAIMMGKIFSNVKFQWLHFVNELISWIVLLFATFGIVHYILQQLIGQKLQKMKKEQQPIIESNLEATSTPVYAFAKRS